MSEKRNAMLASDVRRLVAPFLRECPKECGMVSITEIVLSSDASHATIFVSALMEAPLAIEFLESKRREIQRSIHTLKRKVIPQFHFKHDPRSERGSRIERLLEQ